MCLPWSAQWIHIDVKQETKLQFQTMNILSKTTSKQLKQAKAEMLLKLKSKQ